MTQSPNSYRLVSVTAQDKTCREIRNDEMDYREANPGAGKGPPKDMVSSKDCVFFQKEKGAGPLSLEFTFEEMSGVDRSEAKEVAAARNKVLRKHRLVLAAQTEKGLLKTCSVDLVKKNYSYATTEPEIFHSQSWSSGALGVTLAAGSTKVGPAFSEKCPGETRMTGVGITLGGSSNSQILGLKVVCVDPKAAPQRWPTAVEKTTVQEFTVWETVCKDDSICTQKCDADVSDKIEHAKCISSCTSCEQKDTGKKDKVSTTVYNLENSSLGSAGYISGVFVPQHQDTYVKWYTCPKGQFVTGLSGNIADGVANLANLKVFRDAMSIRCISYDERAEELVQDPLISLKDRLGKLKSKPNKTWLDQFNIFKLNMQISGMTKQLNCPENSAFSSLQGIYIDRWQEKGIISLAGTCGSF